MVQLTRQQWVREFLDGKASRRLECVTRLGTHTADDVREANAAEAELCGFVVNMPQSRNSVTPDELRRLSTGLDPAIVTVGIFADEPVASVADLVEAGVIDAVQLQGSEDDRYLADLHHACDVPIVHEFELPSVA